MLLLSNSSTWECRQFSHCELHYTAQENYCSLLQLEHNCFHFCLSSVCTDKYLAVEQTLQIQLSHKISGSSAAQHSVWWHVVVARVWYKNTINKIHLNVDLRSTMSSARRTFTVIALPCSRAIWDLISSNVTSVWRSHNRGSPWQDLT